MELVKHPGGGPADFVQNVRRFGVLCRILLSNRNSRVVGPRELKSKYDKMFEQQGKKLEEQQKRQRER